MIVGGGANTRSGLEKLPTPLQTSSAILRSLQVSLKLPMTVKFTKAATALRGIKEHAYFRGDSMNSEHVRTTTTFRLKFPFTSHTTM